jgi:pimeloyl-ACP methyl ester carboxylesterase
MGVHNNFSTVKEEYFFVEYKDLRLSYMVFGTGNETVVAMHGHGKHALDFDFLGDASKRVISINLFLHGESTFSDERLARNLIAIEDVEKLLEKLLIQEKINQFHFVAYSQGGRFVLSVLPYFIERVLSVQLLAPDGLNDTNFYSWSQRRWWARRLFKRWTNKPHELLTVANVLAKGKIIHPKIVDFLKFYTTDHQKFKRAFHTWSAFRNLRPQPRKIREALNSHPIPFSVIIGEFDRIITKKSAQGFLFKIGQPDALIVIPAGHDFFREDVIGMIKEELKF